MPRNKDITYIDGYDHRKLEHLYQNHSKMEAAVCADLEKIGFIVHSTPYHKYMTPELQKVLHKNFEINGIYIRSRADRVIVHKESGFACQLEIKTTRFGNDRPVLYLEALPLAIHVHNSRIGIKTLFVYGNPEKSAFTAFWANQNLVPLIKEIRIPPKDRVNRTYYEGKFRLIFGELFSGNIRLMEKMPWAGSGDPYAIIDLNALVQKQKLDMRQMLEDEISLHNLFRIHSDKPLACGYCRKEIDLLEARPVPEEPDSQIGIAKGCMDCRGTFCNDDCIGNHYLKNMCVTKA